MKRNTEIYPYALYKTAFHGGGVVSQHKTLEAAVLAEKRWLKGSQCVCGCVGIAGPKEAHGWLQTGYNAETYYAIKNEADIPASTGNDPARRLVR